MAPPPSLPGRLAFLWRRRERYRAVFGTPAGQEVLADLFAFCGMARMPAVPGDPIMTGVNIGLQRVGQRLGGILAMSDAEILALARNADQPPTDPTED